MTIAHPSPSRLLKSTLMASALALITTLNQTSTTFARYRNSRTYCSLSSLILQARCKCINTLLFFYSIPGSSVHFIHKIKYSWFLLYFTIALFFCEIYSNLISLQTSPKLWNTSTMICIPTVHPVTRFRYKLYVHWIRCTISIYTMIMRRYGLQIR